MPVDLGFVENCEPWRLKSRFFPSKKGGKPAWLHLSSVPGKKELECEYCGDPCVFLCQIYAPYEDDPKAFHRTVYVFVCNKVECCRPNENGNLKVFRSQLERNNNFYPPDPPEEHKDWRTDIKISKWTKTCCICGIAAPTHCSQCKTANYCCRAHQLYHWKNGHKELCSTRPVAVTNDFLFPEHELVIETEDTANESDDDDLEKEKKEIQKYEAMAKSGKAGIFHSQDVDADLMRMAHWEEDETFSKFRLRTELYPLQVLRYDRGGEILYISADNQAKDIPKCSQCNEERQFEFQIMPQLLNFLNLVHSAENGFKSIDWGILAVFTCKKSCTPETGYAREYIWKQDIIHKEENNTKSISPKEDQDT